MSHAPSTLGAPVIRRSSLALILLSLLASIAVSVPVANAGPGESSFVSRINSERTSRGRRAYAVRGDLTSVARSHAARMAARRDIYHNPNLGSQVGNWRALGENVGRGGDVSSIHGAFMSSSSHRGNILSSTYTEVGVGTATGGDGLLYVVQIFRLPKTSSAPAAAPATRTAVRPPAATPRQTTAPRASRTGRSPAAAPTAPRRPVDPRVLLRARLAQAGAYDRRVRPAGLLPELTTYHHVLRTLAAHG